MDFKFWNHYAIFLDNQAITIVKGCPGKVSFLWMIRIIDYDNNEPMYNGTSVFVYFEIVNVTNYCICKLWCVQGLTKGCAVVWKYALLWKAYSLSMAIKCENSTWDRLLSAKFSHLSGWNTRWFLTFEGLTVAENLMKKVQNLASWNIVNYSIEKMEIIHRNEFNGVWKFQGIFNLLTHPLWGGIFTTLKVCFSPKTRWFSFFFNNYKGWKIYPK